MSLFKPSNKESKDEEMSKVVKGISLYCDNEDFFDGRKKYRTVFRKDEISRIYADIILDRRYMSDSYENDLCFRLYRSNDENIDGECLKERPVWKSETVSELECKATVRLSYFFETGTYHIQVFFRGSRMANAKFYVVDIPEDYGKCFSLEDFSFFRGEMSGSKNGQSSFELDGLDVISVSFVAQNKLPAQWPSEFIVSLFDDTGMLKEQAVYHGSYFDQSPDLFHFSLDYGKSKKSYWRKGVYRVEVVFMNELIIVAPFVVGDKNIETPFHPVTVQPRTKHGGKKIVQASALNIKPLEQINGMIGLHTLKKELKRHVDLMQYNKARKEAGYKVLPVALHSVFLGNPGTGKTTVARLMGKIFHELGLLTKGHVVFEERNTLTGRFYGTEEEKTNQAIERAKGGVLFIDEAYNLLAKNDPKDPGRRIIETLLTTLSDESNRDIMVILAGYPDGMTEMLNDNPGMKSRFPNVYHFDDYTVDELMQIADLYLSGTDFGITKEAKETLRRNVEKAYSLRDNKFGNGRYMISLLENEVIPNLATRLAAADALGQTANINLIEKCDIPQLQPMDPEDAMSSLNAMVGLPNLKKNVTDHLNLVRFAKKRNDMGKYTDVPPLHMVFTGNPGTGKTTVAGIIGKIYHSMGILSRGHVVEVSRCDLVDNIIGGTEAKTKKIIELAMGGILFIDEAYTLLGDGKDFGRHVIETLLTTLSKEHIDMVVILAGYPKEMEQLMTSNPGLKSRFPYTFHFEDYSPDELMQIAELTASQKGFVFAAEAKEALNALINKEHQHHDIHFGNARYVTRLITTQIIPNMSKRVLELSETQIEENHTLMETIEKEDIPVEADEIDVFKNKGFDEKAIAKLLAKLDAMVGLVKVKEAIHKFVDVSRYLNQQGKPVLDSKAMKWNFAGNAGTGKSAVAEIFAGLLKAMNLIGKGHIVELKAEELSCVPAYMAEETLKRNLALSQQGLLFVDGFSPDLKKEKDSFDNERLRIHLSSYASLLPGAYALVIAELDVQRKTAPQGLPVTDVASFDHVLVFEDYAEQELLMILQQILKRDNLTMNEQAAQTVTRYISGLCAAKHLGCANARTMNTLANSIVTNAWLRICKSNESNTNGVIINEDVASFVWDEKLTNYQRINPVGFKSRS